MKITFDNKNIRYTGRWGLSDENATATAAGAYFEFAFIGKTAVMHFDLTNTHNPNSHLYISVDNSANIEVSLDTFIRVSTNEHRNHIVKVIHKSSIESQNRWKLPLESKISLVDIEFDEIGVLPEDKRPIIEFIGDSITEGISIDTHLVTYSDYVCNCVYMNDSTASYAYLTAQALNLRPAIMGYGCLGITSEGSGNVPKIEFSYPYCFEDAKKNYIADYIIINHGANDKNSPEDEYIKGYERLLNIVRENNPNAKIISLSAFCGAHAKALGELIKKYNKEKNEEVLFIDSTGWIPVEPAHPHRDGHELVASKLSEILKTVIK